MVLPIDSGNRKRLVNIGTVDGSEIPHHQKKCMMPVNSGINYQPQLVSRISEPSTVWHAMTSWPLWAATPAFASEACSCIPTNFRDTHRLGSLEKTKTVTLIAAGFGNREDIGHAKTSHAFSKHNSKRSSNVGTSRDNKCWKLEVSKQYQLAVSVTYNWATQHDKHGVALTCSPTDDMDDISTLKTFLPPRVHERQGN